VFMRAFIATTVVIALALLGHIALGGMPVQGQSIQTVVSPGERVTLRFALPEGSLDTCTVINVRGDFVQCEVPDPFIGPKSHERWYNLHLVKEIEKPGKQQ